MRLRTFGAPSRARPRARVRASPRQRSSSGRQRSPGCSARAHDPDVPDPRRAALQAAPDPARALVHALERRPLAAARDRASPTSSSASTSAPSRSQNAKVRGIGHAIDMRRFPPPGGPKLHDGPLRLLALGRMTAWKGYTTMLAGLELATAQGLDATLEIRGPALTSDEREHLGELQRLVSASPVLARARPARAAGLAGRDPRAARRCRRAPQRHAAAGERDARQGGVRGERCRRAGALEQCRARRVPRRPARQAALRTARPGRPGAGAARGRRGRTGRARDGGRGAPAARRGGPLGGVVGRRGAARAGSRRQGPSAPAGVPSERVTERRPAGQPAGDASGACRSGAARHPVVTATAPDPRLARTRRPPPAERRRARRARHRGPGARPDDGARGHERSCTAAPSTGRSSGRPGRPTGSPSSRRSPSSSSTRPASTRCGSAAPGQGGSSRPSCSWR